MLSAQDMGVNLLLLLPALTLPVTIIIWMMSSQLPGLRKKSAVLVAIVETVISLVKLHAQLGMQLVMPVGNWVTLQECVEGRSR